MPLLWAFSLPRKTSVAMKNAIKFKFDKLISQLAKLLLKRECQEFLYCAFQISKTKVHKLVPTSLNLTFPLIPNLPICFSSAPSNICRAHSSFFKTTYQLNFAV